MDDKQLFEIWQNSDDRDSFRKLCEKEKNKCRNFLSRYVKQLADIEDVWQDAQLALYQKKDAINNLKHFYSLIYVYKRRFALKKVNLGKQFSSLLDTPDPSTTTVGEVSNASENASRLTSFCEGTLKQLPDNYRTILRLLYVEDLDIPETAKVMQLSVRRTRQLRDNARRRFKQVYGSLAGRGGIPIN